MAKKKRVEKRKGADRGIASVEFGVPLLSRIRAEVQEGSVGAWVREACERRLDECSARVELEALTAKQVAGAEVPAWLPPITSGGDAFFGITRQTAEAGEPISPDWPPLNAEMLQRAVAVGLVDQAEADSLSGLAGLAQREALDVAVEMAMRDVATSPRPSFIADLLTGRTWGKDAQMRADLASRGGGFLFSEAHGTEVVPAENLAPSLLAEGGTVNAGATEGIEMVRALFAPQPRGRWGMGVVERIARGETPQQVAADLGFSIPPTDQAEGHGSAAAQVVSPSEGVLVSVDRRVTDARVQTGASAPAADAVDRSVSDDWWR